MTPRHLFQASLLLLVAALAAVATGCSDERDPIEGPFAVGTAAYHVVDRDRDEPESEDPDDDRELMIRAFYPTGPTGPTEAGAGQRAPYFLNATEGQLNAQLLGLPADALEVLTTRSTLDAALVEGEERFPVLLFSEGLGTPVAFYTYLLEEIASRGYVVLAISHPYKAGVVVFPDGRVALPTPNDGDVEIWRNRVIETWSADQRFVAGWIAGLDAAGSGDRMSGRLDLGRMGVLGHSVGAAASSQSCAEDARFIACSNLDGSVGAAVDPAAIDKPFLLMRSELEESTLAGFFAGLAGTSYRIAIAGADHNDYSDLATVVEVLNRGGAGILPADLLLGTIGPARGFELVTAHVLAFFDTYLKWQEPALLESPSSFPEITIERRDP
jgi:hypothetical protein